MTLTPISVGERHPALVHTGLTSMHFPTLLKAVEVLDELRIARGKDLSHVWGYDPDVTNTEHHSRRALDFMVYTDRAAGDWIADYVIRHGERLGLIHVIWFQRIWRGPYSTSTNPKGAWYDMADRGSTTQNHMDHPHVWFTESEYTPPQAAEEEPDMEILNEILAEVRIIRQAVAPEAEPPTTTTTTTVATTTTTTTPKPVVWTPTTTTTTTSATPKNTIGETLRRGDRGTAVTAAQRRLTLHGVTTTQDGVFGAGTEANVKQFQESKRLNADGVVGAASWAALLAPTVGEGVAVAREVLPILGWRDGSAQSVKDFQRMWNLGDALAVDGIPGAATVAALTLSKERRAAGKPDISEHFSAREFWCKCGGKYADCRRIWADRRLVRGAERYRTLAGPFTPVSACRCRQHNAAVGGYDRSQHVLGFGMDVVARFTVAQVRALGEFPAIGYNASNGTVRHVDYRNYGPDNYPAASGSTSSPYTYVYG